MRPLVAALALLAACRPPPDPRDSLVSARRTDAIRLADQIGRVLDHAARLPPLTRTIPLEPPLDVEPLSRGIGTNPHWNALILHDFQKPLLRKPRDRFGDHALWSPPDPLTYALEVSLQGTIDGMPLQMKEAPDIAAWFDAIAQLRYVVVLHDEVYVEPIADNTSFHPGRYFGEARVYRIADGVYLGGFRFGSTGQASHVQTTRGREDIDVGVDFKEHVAAAFGAELARRFPGSIAAVR